MSTTGGYTTTKAKARKPRALMMGGLPAAWCDYWRGHRGIRMTSNLLFDIRPRDVERAQQWLARAAAWCAEGERR